MLKKSKIREYFGKNPDVMSESNLLELKEKSFCPFSSSKCFKASKNPLLGTCSVSLNNHQCIVCPKRFLENGLIFDEIKSLSYFDHMNVSLSSEVKFGGCFFDYVFVGKGLVSTKYLIAEVQALDTCGSTMNEIEKILPSTRKEDKNRGKPLMGNWKMTSKTYLNQIAEKLNIVVKDGQRLAIVIQKPFFDYLFKDKEHFIRDFSNDQSLMIFVYDIDEKGMLVSKEKHSMTTSSFRFCFFNEKNRTSFFSTPQFKNDQLKEALNRWDE